MERERTFFPYELGYKSCYSFNKTFRLRRWVESTKHHSYWVFKILCSKRFNWVKFNTQTGLAKEISVLDQYRAIPFFYRLKLIFLALPVLFAYEGVIKEGSCLVKRSFKRTQGILQSFFNRGSVIISSNDILFWDRLLLFALVSKGYPCRGYFHGFPAVKSGISQKLFSEIIVPSKEFAMCIRAPSFVVRQSGLEWLHKWSINTSCKRLVICTFPEPIRLIKGSDFDTNKPISSALEYINGIVDKLNISRLYLRLHPSESEIYYVKNLRNVKITFVRRVQGGDYYIGPMSTFFFNAIQMGSPYLIYEPIANGVRLNGTKLYPGYFGSVLSNYIFTDLSNIPSAMEIQKLFTRNKVRSLFKFYAPY